MAYSVSQDFKNKLYSGDNDFRATLIIDGNTIPEEQISSISISSPIIDDSKDIFYLGSFISQKLTIKFANLDGLSIESGQEVSLSIGQYVNNAWVDVPIGVYLVDELGENYQKTCEINCLDYAIKFKPNIDYSPCFVDGKATIDTILQYICTQCGVTLGYYPVINGDVEIGTYDASISGKQWISYIAEIKGCNAKMDRNGYLTLQPIKQSSTQTIDAEQSASFELGEYYNISKLVYTDAIRNYTYGGDTYNTLFVRTENPFVSDEVISDLYDEIEGFEAYSLKTHNIGDFTLDAWDNLVYTLDGNSYKTLNNNTIKYEITIMGDVETKISTKQQEVTTNVIQPNDVSSLKFKVSTEVNNLTGEINLKVDKNDIINQINVSTEGIKIQGSKISLAGQTIDLTGDNITIESDNFKVDKEGNLVCNNSLMNDANFKGGHIELYDETGGNASLEINQAIRTNVLEIGEDYELHTIVFDRDNESVEPLIDNTQNMNVYVLGFTTNDKHYKYRFNRSYTSLISPNFVVENLVEEIYDGNDELISQHTIWHYDGQLDGTNGNCSINKPTIVDEEITITEYDNTSYSGKISDVTECLYVLTTNTVGMTKLYNDFINTGSIHLDEGISIDEDIYLYGTMYKDDRDVFANQTLWSGAWYMNATQTVQLDENVSEQPHGIVLVWSAYTSQGAQDYNWHTDFIPKKLVTSNGYSYVSVMASNNFGNIATKGVTIYDDEIVGRAENTQNGTSSGTNIKYNNGAYVLRYVIGV